jgi:spectrin beta
VTEQSGCERVASVNGTADNLIKAGHSDGATISEWKDGLNMAWQELLRLMESRNRMLVVSGELRKFTQDCTDVLGRCLKRQYDIPDELGLASTLMSELQVLKHDLLSLQSQVQTVQDDSARLQALYASESAADKVKEVADREAGVLAAWTAVQDASEARFSKLSAMTGMLYNFFAENSRALIVLVENSKVKL